MNTGVHSSPGQGRGRNTAGGILRVLDTVRGRIQRASRLAHQYETRRRLLKTLILNPGGLTYRELQNTLNVSDRWTRKLVADLRAEGVVETPGNPSIITFASEEIELAIRELLAFLASDWVTNVTTNPENGSSLLSKTTDAAPSGEDIEKYLQLMAGLLRGNTGWSL